MSESLSQHRVRVFHVDFNDDPLIARVAWYRECPSQGEKVLLIDADFDVVKGEVVSVVDAPDREARKCGYVECSYDSYTWLDGEEVLALALDRLLAMVEQRGIR